MKHFIFILFYASFFCSNKIYSQKTHIYSWVDREVANYFDNVTPFCWVGTYNDPTKGIIIYTDIESIKNKLLSQPEGKRTLFSWNLHRTIDSDTNDYLKDDLGIIKGYIDTFNMFQPFPQVWCDSGVVATQAVFDTLFYALYKAGAPIDILVLDDERIVSNWFLSNQVNSFEIYTEDKTTVLENYYDAIEGDPHADEMFDILGFNTLDTVRNWTLNDTMYLIFNEYWSDKKSEYLNQAVYGPLKKYYPNASLSNYSNQSKSKDYPVPDFNGHKKYRGGDGNHVGTHQSFNFYGLLGRNFNSHQPKPLGFYYDTTQFNAFMLNVNKMRSMILGDTVPVIPWIAFHGFSNNPACRYTNNDWYIENIYHLLLSGADDLLYWSNNWSGSLTVFLDETKLISDAVIEYDSLLTKAVPYSTYFYSGNIASGNDLADWHKNYLLTGKESDSTKLWRLSVDTIINVEIISGSATNPLKIVVFDTDEYTRDTLVFPNSYIFYFSDTLSKKGYWIVEDKNVAASYKTEVTEIPVSVSEMVTISPNPNNSFIKVNISNTSIVFEKLEILTLSGKLLVISNNQTIDLSEMSKGIYLAKISTNYGIITKRIILD